VSEDDTREERLESALSDYEHEFGMYLAAHDNVVVWTDDKSERDKADKAASDAWNDYLKARGALIYASREQGKAAAQAQLDDAGALVEFLRLLIRDRDALIERAARTLEDGLKDAREGPVYRLDDIAERLDKTAQAALDALKSGHQ
jgi:hypothetical protein